MTEQQEGSLIFWIGMGFIGLGALFGSVFLLIVGGIFVPIGLYMEREK